jgi:penicillin-binding protein-related factor A (putative recombinase)
MSKNSDFSFSDNHCAHQISHKNKNAKEKSYSLGGCILYPILNGNNECLAVVRQYFYDYYERNQQKIRAISLKKLREIGIFIEYTTKMNDKLR